MVMVFFFRLIFLIARIPCTRGVCGPFVRMLLVFLPLDGPISYASPQPPYTQHTNPLSVLSADPSQSLYATSISPCCLSVVPYIHLLSPAPPLFTNSLWMTTCDLRVENPISPVHNISVWAGVVLHYPFLLFLCLSSRSLMSLHSDSYTKNHHWIQL